MIDVGFLDPFCLPSRVEPSGVLVQLVARVAMNIRVVEQLYQRLHQTLVQRCHRSPSLNPNGTGKP
ncbi:MAG: hypothetical protein RMI89_03095 [Gloeomargarita sp. SKYBB_i_bin120]|nr:hypothetical protein [Gloeomargarita sp. SKYG98]MCS7291947.1 hypothetical protein [Gloeomargarita sp. SKYB120]MDW8177507.1 hypothetical protein [Gloeomargarita sp. SKYBB_i_bin120]